MNDSSIFEDDLDIFYGDDFTVEAIYAPNLAEKKSVQVILDADFSIQQITKNQYDNSPSTTIRAISSQVEEFGAEAEGFAEEYSLVSIKGVLYWIARSDPNGTGETLFIIEKQN